MIPGHHAEDLNEGIGEGVAYRGRILVELVSQPGGEKTDVKRGKKVQKVCCPLSLSEVLPC
jgi:hypothetical protein